MHGRRERDNYNGKREEVSVNEGWGRVEAREGRVSKTLGNC
jgi:hypothetical protein